MPSDADNRPESSLTPVPAPTPVGTYPEAVLPPPASPGPTVNISTLWRAFRRRWLLAITLAMLVGTAGGVGLWFARSPRYTAAALLRIAPGQTRVLPSSGNDERSGEDRNY